MWNWWRSTSKITIDWEKKLHKCATKVKELERKSEHAPAAASEEPESSRQAKRLECTNLSSLEKEDLQPKPPKQPRTME